VCAGDQRKGEQQRYRVPQGGSSLRVQ
jgi:hypothetical protein